MNSTGFQIPSELLTNKSYYGLHLLLYLKEISKEFLNFQSHRMDYLVLLMWRKLVNLNADACL